MVVVSGRVERVDWTHGDAKLHNIAKGDCCAPIVELLSLLAKCPFFRQRCVFERAPVGKKVA